jgi:hypothetical protein
MRFILAILVVFCACTLSLWAQNESKIWYFGNGAGLDFSSGKPHPITNGKLYTDEGCATATDPYGNLMFYTNGVTVWDRTHQIMKNGSGLKGGVSSTHSAMIVQRPQHKSQYFLFTVDQFGGSGGLSFSLIDMSRNGGQGEVIEKNNKLLSPVSEKLAFVPHKNGKDVWIVTHKWSSNAFYSFLMTSAGIEDLSISKIGSYHTDEERGKNRQSIGYLVASGDGSKLASAVCYRSKKGVEVFDFNSGTGKVSNWSILPAEGSAYGLAFSPDNEKLYVSFLEGASCIQQYTLKSKEWQLTYDVPASEMFTYGAMQMGPDGGLYIAKTWDALDVILNPNLSGEKCAFGVYKVSLAGHSSSFGLPNPPYISKPGEDEKLATTTDYVPSNLEQWDEDKVERIKIGQDTTLRCAEGFEIDATISGAKYRWSTGDTTQTIVVKKTGIYSVKITKEGKKMIGDRKITFKGKPPVFRCMLSFNPDAALNKTFAFVTENTFAFEMKVFNKKGKILFSTYGTGNEWEGLDKNGKEVKPGTYNWEVTYKTKCDSKTVITKKGEVKLYRSPNKRT